MRTSRSLTTWALNTRIATWNSWVSARDRNSKDSTHQTLSKAVTWAKRNTFRPISSEPISKHKRKADGSLDGPQRHIMVLYEDTRPIIEWSRRQKNGVLVATGLASFNTSKFFHWGWYANVRFPAIFYSKPEKDRDSLVIAREEWFRKPPADSVIHCNVAHCMCMLWPHWSNGLEAYLVTISCKLLTN